MWEKREQNTLQVENEYFPTFKNKQLINTYLPGRVQVEVGT
jgi:hypothetical protein